MTDLHARLRLLEADHEPDGWPAVRMRDVSALLDEVERLRAAVAAEHQRCVAACKRVEEINRDVRMMAFGASKCIEAIEAE